MMQEPPSLLSAQQIALRERIPLSEVIASRCLGPYRGYAEMVDALASQCEDRKDAAIRLSVLGASVDNLPIFAVRVCKQGIREHELPTTVVVSGLHPMEWIGIESNLCLLDRLKHRLPENRNVVVIPIANPDGVRHVERNLRQGKRTMVRHNRRGVDLNRNFPRYWSERGWVQRRLRSLYASGDAPASEPEVSGIVRFLKQFRVDRALSLHSFGGAILYPYGALPVPPPDAEIHYQYATKIAERIGGRRRYRVEQSARWVPGFRGSGMEIDWFHDEFGACSLLVECSHGGWRGGSFTLPKLMEPFAWFNPDSVLTTRLQIAQAVEGFVRGE
jgi:hypothetical protein